MNNINKPSNSQTHSTLITERGIREIVLREPHHSQTSKETIPVFSRWIGSWYISLRRRAFNSTELSCHYDRAAPRWKGMLKCLGYPHSYETLLRNLLRTNTQQVIGIQARVLDCGVGTGAMSLALACVSPNSFQLDAVDISPRMLQWAHRNFRDRDMQVSLRQADVRCLPYQDNEFDLVMSAHVLEHLVDPRSAIREMVRVLKPGGFFVVCLTRRSALGLFVHLKWRTHWVTPEQARMWLLECGLEQVRCLASDEHTWFKRFSVACVGQKPLGM